MSLRIFTYLTLDAAGDPSAFGASFDVVLYEADAEMSQNTLVQSLRDQTQIIVDDPQQQLPLSMRLALASAHVDLESNQLYLGSTRYLSAVLYYHKTQKMPICLFFQSAQTTAQKCYICRILDMDPVVAALSTINTAETLYLQVMEPAPPTINLGLFIDRDGIFTDIDDVASGSYHVREPAS